MTEPPTTCLLADDHPALLHAVSAFLEDEGYEVVGPAHDGERALALAAELQPDVALVDYRMPRLGGAELVRRLREASPDLLVAVYTAEADQDLARDAIAAGATAIVLKEAPLADLVRALDAIRAGRQYVDAVLAAKTIIGQPRSDGPRLTQRESEVLQLLAEGLPHVEVGRRLGISAETARTHLRKACGRLGAPTRTAAVAKALRLGLIA